MSLKVEMLMFSTLTILVIYTVTQVNGDRESLERVITIWVLYTVLMSLRLNKRKHSKNKQNN